MTSYFEIGGMIVESDSSSDSSFQSTVSVLEYSERGRNSTRSQGFSLKTSSDGTSPESMGVAEVIGRINRAQRARRALTIAATLAAVDGPLPIGDTLAIVGLTIYAGWEIGHAVGILD